MSGKYRRILKSGKEVNGESDSLLYQKTTLLICFMEETENHNDPRFYENAFPRPYSPLSQYVRWVPRGRNSLWPFLFPYSSKGLPFQKCYICKKVSICTWNPGGVKSTLGLKVRILHPFTVNAKLGKSLRTYMNVSVSGHLCNSLYICSFFHHFLVP